VLLGRVPSVSALRGQRLAAGGQRRLRAAWLPRAAATCVAGHGQLLLPHRAAGHQRRAARHVGLGARQLGLGTGQLGLALATCAASVALLAYSVPRTSRTVCASWASARASATWASAGVQPDQRLAGGHGSASSARMATTVPATCGVICTTLPCT
jgi:hypothetical protein